MDYATQDDLVERFGLDEITQISDETGSGTLDTGRVAKAIADAGAYIEGFLASRYTLPLTAVPASLNLHACNVARYMLARFPTDEMRKRYDDSTAWLKQVGRGDFGLGIDADNKAPGEPGGVAVSAGRRVFTPESLGDYLYPSTGRRRP